MLCLDYPSQWNHSSVFSGSLYFSSGSEVTMKDMGETDRYRYAVLCLDYPSQWNHSSVFSGSLYCSRDSEVTMKDMGETGWNRSTTMHNKAHSLSIWFWVYIICTLLVFILICINAICHHRLKLCFSKFEPKMQRIAVKIPINFGTLSCNFIFNF